jgi:hypothetical protein
MGWALFELEFRTPAISASDRGGDS